MLANKYCVLFAAAMIIDKKFERIDDEIQESEQIIYTSALWCIGGL